MTETMKTIRRELALRNIKQVEFAEMTGYEEVSISRWLNGRRIPQIDKVEKMAEVLGLQVNSICPIQKGECKDKDTISREATVKRLCKLADFLDEKRHGSGSPYIMAALFIQSNKEEFPSVTPSRPEGHCKECKYFEYDSMATVDGVPIIVAHEICSRWGDGCKTREDGYCFLFEPQERSDKE